MVFDLDYTLHIQIEKQVGGRYVDRHEGRQIDK